MPHKKKHNSAINAFKHSIRIDGNNVTAYIYLINLSIQINQLTEAEETLRGIIPSCLDNLRLKCLSERIKYKKGDRKSANKFIQNILKSNVIDNDIYLDLGDLCIEMEQYTTAIELFERYLATSPSDATVVANIATCYARLGKLESAKFGFQAALQIDPGCTYARQNLVALNKLGS